VGKWAKTIKTLIYQGLLLVKSLKIFGQKPTFFDQNDFFNFFIFLKSPLFLAKSPLFLVKVARNF